MPTKEDDFLADLIPREEAAKLRGYKNVNTFNQAIHHGHVRLTAYKFGKGSHFSRREIVEDIKRTARKPSKG